MSWKAELCARGLRISLTFSSPGVPISCRQQPTLGFGSKGFNLRVIFSLPLSISLTRSLSPAGLCFVKGTNGNFQLGRKGGERNEVRSKVREEAPYTDSIRRDQIKLLASSAPEADRLTVCPIWVSGTVRVGAWGVLRSLQPAAPPPLGTTDANSDNNSEISPLHIHNKSPFNMMSSLTLCSASPSAAKMLFRTLGEKVGSRLAPRDSVATGAQGHHWNSSVSKHKVSLWLPCTSMQSIKGHRVCAEVRVCMYTGPKSKQVTPKDRVII